MKKQKIVLLFLLVVLLCSLSITSSAHSGKTDMYGGHYDRSSGEYHYHHGKSAHDHYDIDGDGVIDCPFEFNKYDNDHNKEKTKKEVTFGDVLGAILMVVIFSPFIYAIVLLVCMVVVKIIEKITRKESEILESDKMKRALLIVTIFLSVISLLGLLLT